VIQFFAFLLALRRAIYATNAIESIHLELRKIVKAGGHFSSDAAATKLIRLPLRNITAVGPAAAAPGLGNYPVAPR
jgi:transposase-like protein